MSRKLITALSLSLCLASTAVLAADATLHQVYQAAEAGNYRAAQSMMDQVLHDHPNSAKAHFVEAELLAKEGQLRSSQTELATAERLDPSLSFAKPEAVTELKARFAPPTTTAPMATTAQGNGAGMSWGLILVGVGLLLAVLYFLRSRSQAPVVVPGGAGGWSSGGGNWGSGPQPYGAGGVGPVTGPMAPAGGGMGSGILGSLATGAAVGAGVVAGEALMHRVLDGGHREDVMPSQTGSNWEPASQPAPQYDMGGQDFGVNDAGSWDDSSSSGSDDWT
ncbi:MAG TPA: tetratricopeptide repeat protein [Rhodocyclaceae bacterium]